MILRRLAFVALTASVLLPDSLSQDTPALRHGIGFGTFSDLHCIEESGDVLGTEVTVIPQYTSAYAIFQCAEGAPTTPVLIPVQIRGNQITFKVSSPESCPGTYTGVVTSSGMKLSVTQSDFNGNGVLPRRKSYWAR